MNRRTAVLLTCFNRKATTLRCLDRLLIGQNYLPDVLDVYLVDDASPDGTGAAVREAFPEVRVIAGDGKRFWCGGMRLAWSEASKRDYDFYVWLNDDTHLLPHALRSMFDLYETLEREQPGPHYIVGSVRDPETGAFSYGGMTWERAGLGVKSSRMLPEGFPKPCDTLNGNFLLISREVFRRTGNLLGDFTHGIGDFDYGLRARAAGCRLWATGDFLAECAPNTSDPGWFDPTRPLAERWKILNSPKGMPPLEYLTFVSRHGGPAWPLTAAKLFGRLLFPQLWQRAKAGLVES